MERTFAGLNQIENRGSWASSSDAPPLLKQH